MNALTEPHLLVLRAIMAGSRTVKEVALAVGAPKPTAYDHMKALTEAGLITHPQGTHGTHHALVVETPLMECE